MENALFIHVKHMRAIISLKITCISNKYCRVYLRKSRRRLHCDFRSFDEFYGTDIAVIQFSGVHSSHIYLAVLFSYN